jgi:hypothetical protein
MPEQGRANMTAKAQRTWVHQSTLVSEQLEAVSPLDEEQLFNLGCVRITTGSLGTEVRWTVATPCVASLFKTISLIASLKAPYILRFYASGWFEEIFRHPAAACRRIEDIIARGDRHLISRVFIESATPDSPLLPDVLKTALNQQTILEDYSVDCTYDADTNEVTVDRIGPMSAIGRVWGTITTSHPCQPAGSYGDPVNATYEHVLRTGKPRYDQVLAALRLPDNAIHWVPYHRVVFPKRQTRGTLGVAVLSQISRVDIQVL